MRTYVISRILVSFYGIINFVEHVVVSSESGADGGCTLPEHPKFGSWSLIGGSPNKNPRDFVASGAVLKFECNARYKVSMGVKFVACFDQKWSVDDMPTCLRTCPPLKSSKHTNIRCFNKANIEIKCDEATDDASAKFTCDPFYESMGQGTIIRYCVDGSWNLPSPVCQPICGEKRVSAEPLSAISVETGEYPWVTSIYRKKEKGPLENICQGSMVTEKVILTVAHCVTDESGNVLPKDDYIIGVGKHYNKFNDSRDVNAQYSKLESIVVPQLYKGNSLRYSSDIALLITKEELILSRRVQPICYHDLSSIRLTPGLIGSVIAWDHSAAENGPSDRSKLVEIDVPYREEKCREELPEDFEKYYTSDKICVGYYNGSRGICKGNSGAGLIFKNPRNNRYYIHGIASIQSPSVDICPTQYSTLYTRVASHYDWLDRLIARHSV